MLIKLKDVFEDPVVFFLIFLHIGRSLQDILGDTSKFL